MLLAFSTGKGPFCARERDGGRWIEIKRERERERESDREREI